MYQITVIVGQTAWALLFKSESEFEGANEKLIAAKSTPTTTLQFGAINTNNILTLKDDFGQVTHLEVSAISGWLNEDMRVSQLAHVERGLHHARGQAKAQQAAQQDPVLRTAQMSNGPAVISPFGRGN